MTRHLLATAAATVAAVGLLTALPGDVTSDAHVASWVAPCQFEDSPGPCYWDARAMGNGEGNSFVRGADGGTVITERG